MRIKGFKIRDKYKAQKGEKVVVLANHVTDYDPILIRLCLNRYLYTLSTDNIYSTRITRYWIPRLGGIPKRKGLTDITSLKEMLRIASHNGSLLIFAEGNRSYADFQFYIAPNFSSLLYKLKATIVLYNIVGGFGSYPRFGNKRRRGKAYTKLVKVLKYDEYKDMDPAKLNEIITTNLKYFDVDSGYKYKSNKKAEYLERMLFVCPKCGKMHTLNSKGNHLVCSNCGLDVTYNEDLTISSNDPAFKFTRLSEWYFYQKEYVKNLNIDDSFKFEDDNVTLKTVNPFELSKKLAKGKLVLTKDTISVGDYKMDVKDIEIASPMSGRKLVFTINNQNLQIRGGKKFNALKYVLLFNKLDTKMKNEKVDNYFSL